MRYRGIILADQLAVCQMGQAEIRILLIANHPLIFLDLDPYISSRSSSYFTGSYWFNLLFSLAKKPQSLHLFAYDCGPGLAPQPNGVKAQEQLHDTATCQDNRRVKDCNLLVPGINGLRFKGNLNQKPQMFHGFPIKDGPFL